MSEPTGDMPDLSVPDVDLPDIGTPNTDRWADPTQSDSGPALPSMPTPGSDEGEPDIGWTAAADDIEAEAATLRQMIEGGQYSRYPSLEETRRQELATLENRVLEYRAHVLAQEQVLWDQTLAHERGRAGGRAPAQDPTQGQGRARRRMGGPQQTAASEQAVRDAAKHGQPKNPIGGGSARRKRRNPLGARVADGNGQGRGLTARLGALINVNIGGGSRTTNVTGLNLGGGRAGAGARIASRRGR